MEAMAFGTEHQFGIQSLNTGEKPRLGYADAAKKLIAANNQMLMFGIPPRSGEGGQFRSWLYNGGLLYLDDVKHPEYSTPECKSLEDLIIYEMAGRRITQTLISLISRPLKSEGMAQYFIVANNTDHSYVNDGVDNHRTVFGYHENYSATNPEGEIEGILPFLATRHIYAGAGFIVPDYLKKGESSFRLAQRAAAVRWGTQGLMVGEYSRLIGPNRQNSKVLHVTIGDANVSTFATALKIGTTLLTHELLEEGWKPSFFTTLTDSTMTPKETFDNIKEINKHLGPKGWICKLGGKTISVIGIQRVYLKEAERRFFGRDRETNWVLYNWKQTLDQLEKDPMECNGLDWVIKRRFFDSHYRSWTKSELVRFDVAYHSADPDRSTFLALAREPKLAGLVVAERLVKDAMEQPPQNTRAKGRGMIVQAIKERMRQGADEKPYISWSEVSYAGQKVPMPDPGNTYGAEAEGFVRSIEGSRSPTKERR